MIIKETSIIHGRSVVHRYSNTNKPILYKGESYKDIYELEVLQGEDSEYVEVADTTDAVIDDAFWEVFQKRGTRADYSYAFANWEHTEIVPKYACEGDNFVYMLMNSTIEDASNIFIHCGAETPTMQGLCMNCKNMITPPTITFTNAPMVRTWTSAFAGCESMTQCNIDFGDPKNGEINPVSVRNNMQNTFFNCSALEHITFSGCGSPKSLDLSPCVNLTAESMQSLADHLYDLSDTSSRFTIKVASTTLARCSQKLLDQFESIGWVLQSVEIPASEQVENSPKGDETR